MQAVRSPSAGFRPEVAEMLGVFALVFAGVGAIVADAATGALGHLGVSLTFALTILIMVYALGHLCGAHFNPAITIAFAVTGHFPWRRVPTYLAAQFAGATLAAWLVNMLIGNAVQGVTLPRASVLPLNAVAIESIFTFFLAFVIIAVATDRRAPAGTAGIAIGFAVAVGAFVAGPLTGGSMNPARTLGPALVSGVWTDAWVYLVGPTVGAVAAMLLYGLLRDAKIPKPARSNAPDPAMPADEVV